MWEDIFWEQRSSLRAKVGFLRFRPTVQKVIKQLLWQIFRILGRDLWEKVKYLINADQLAKCHLPLKVKRMRDYQWKNYMYHSQRNKNTVSETNYFWQNKEKRGKLEACYADDLKINPLSYCVIIFNILFTIQSLIQQTE